MPRRSILATEIRLDDGRALVDTITLAQRLGLSPGTIDSRQRRGWPGTKGRRLIAHARDEFKGKLYVLEEAFELEAKRKVARDRRETLPAVKVGQMSFRAVSVPLKELPAADPLRKRRDLPCGAYLMNAAAIALQFKIPFQTVCSRQRDSGWPGLDGKPLPTYRRKLKGSVREAAFFLSCDVENAMETPARDEPGAYSDGTINRYAVSRRLHCSYKFIRQLEAAEILTFVKQQSPQTGKLVDVCTVGEVESYEFERAQNRKQRRQFDGEWFIRRAAACQHLHVATRTLAKYAENEQPLVEGGTLIRYRRIASPFSPGSGTLWFHEADTLAVKKELRDARKERPPKGWLSTGRLFPGIHSDELQWLHSARESGELQPNRDWWRRRAVSVRTEHQPLAAIYWNPATVPPYLEAVLRGEASTAPARRGNGKPAGSGSSPAKNKGGRPPKWDALREMIQAMPGKSNAEIAAAYNKRYASKLGTPGWERADAKRVRIVKNDMPKPNRAES